MDLHHVVRRVSEALGSTATPEQIERAAAVVLEEAQTPAQPSTARLLVVAAAPPSSTLLPELLTALVRLEATPTDVAQRANAAGVMVWLEVTAEAVSGGAAALQAHLDEVASRHGAALSVYHGDVAAALLAS